MTNVLFKLYALDWTVWNRITILLTGKVKYNTQFGHFIIHGKKHSSVNEIKSAYSNLPVLTNVRNPFDLYVSEYEFGWWKRKEYLKY